MTGTDLTPQAPRGALTITTDQDAFTDAQIEALGLSQASRGEALVFLHTCQRTGLDPAARQIHAVFRQGKMSIQTGIDGYRLIADRTGVYAGNEVTAEGPLDDGGAVEWVEVTVRKIVAGQVVAFKARAYYREYVQRRQDGSPNSMWRNMPRNQLAKCAEAAALRKAFPQDLSGVYTDDEMGQADRHSPTVTTAVPAATPAQLRALGDAAAAAGLSEPRDVHDAVVGIIGRDIASASDLTAAEAQAATEHLAMIAAENTAAEGEAGA